MKKETSIKNCVRCGGDHDKIVFKILKRPIEIPCSPPVSYTHWAMCPSAKEPILMKITRTWTVGTKVVADVEL